MAACTTAIKNHIKEEFTAAFAYMGMGAYFAQSTVGRPGMAKFMLESASEERSHGIMMMDYLNKRGGKITQTENFAFNFNDKTDEEKKQEISVLAALKKALAMEIHVTQKIHSVIEHCGQDFHAADVFTDPILDEQHEGIRKLQGAIRDYENLAHGQEDENEKAMVDFLFDQKVLKGAL